MNPHARKISQTLSCAQAQNWKHADYAADAQTHANARTGRQAGRQADTHLDCSIANGVARLFIAAGAHQHHGNRSNLFRQQQCVRQHKVLHDVT